MRSKRLSILVPCLLIAIVLVFIFLHAHHRHESVAAVPPSPPTVAVIAAHLGTIANQLSVAGIFQLFQDVEVHGKGQEEGGRINRLQSTRGRCRRRNRHLTYPLPELLSEFR